MNRNIEYDAEVARLIQELGKSDPETRLNAVEGLGHMAAKSAIPHLAKLLPDADESLRRKIIWAIQEIGLGGRDQNAPFFQLFDHPNAEVRLAALQCLVLYQEDRPVVRDAMSPLIRLLANDDDRRVRARSAAWLTRLEPGVIKSSLESQEENEREPVDRCQESSLPERLQTLLVRADSGAVDIEPFLSDPQVPARVAAGIALSRLGSKGKDSLFILLRDKDAEVRTCAARALGVVGDPGAAPALEEALRDLDEAVRFEALIALGALFDQFPIPPPSQRRLWRARFGRHGPPPRPPANQQTVRAVASCLRDPKIQVRRGACTALSHLGPPAAIATLDLLDVLMDEDEQIRNQAISAIAAIKARSIDAVRRLLSMFGPDNRSDYWWILLALRAALEPMVPPAMKASVHQLYDLREAEPATIAQAVDNLLKQKVTS